MPALLTDLPLIIVKQRKRISYYTKVYLLSTQLDKYNARSPQDSRAPCMSGTFLMACIRLPLRIFHIAQNTLFDGFSRPDMVGHHSTQICCHSRCAKSI